jgi:hypothetical protein
MQAKKGVRVLGKEKRGSSWERFDRLQRTANTLAGGVREPKGVHRFKTWEEFNEWKTKFQVRGGRRRGAIS